MRGAAFPAAGPAGGKIFQKRPFTSSLFCAIMYLRKLWAMLKKASSCN
jgi:hypothetical protein